MDAVNSSQVEEFRAQILALRAELDRAESRGKEARQTVELDQQSTGRLSRMDALQHQAMAQAQSRQRQAQHQRIDAALVRIEEGEFGYCLDCGEEIPPLRLRLDPTIPRCISCASG